MAYNPRTGITSYNQLDPSTDPNAALALDEEMLPSTQTAMPPAYVPSAFPTFGFWGELSSLDAPDPSVLGPSGSELNAGAAAPFYDPLPAQQMGSEMVAGGPAPVAPPSLFQRAQDQYASFDRGPLTLAPAFGTPGSPEMKDIEYEANSAMTAAVLGAPVTLNQMYAAYLLSQNPAYPKTSAFNEFMSVAMPIMIGALLGAGVAGAGAGAAASGATAGGTTSFVGSGGDFEAAARGAAAGAIGGGVGAPVADYLGGGMLGQAGASALTSGSLAALQGEDPWQAALTSGLTSAGSNLAAPLVQSAFDTFDPDAVFADVTADMDSFSTEDFLRRAGEFVAPPDFFAEMGMEPLMPPAIGPDGLPARSLADLTAPRAMYSTPAQIGTGEIGSFSTPAMTTMQEAPGMLPLQMPAAQALTQLYPETMSAVSQFSAPQDSGISALEEEFAARTAEPAPAPAEPSPEQVMASRIERLAKIGARLAGMNDGQGVPADAPQRAEGQDDAAYAEALATYINVDAKALSEMGLVPGTPEYYDYIMSQLDATLSGLTEGLDVDAPNLEQQLRSKTREELDALRRALFVRGQLDQLMGSGSYTDPFTGRAEEVITNGRRVNPAVAAYHRGLGRTAEEFARLSPGERRRAVGGFLERAPDLYGMQARSDARDEQAMQAQAFLEDLKRRRGMFGGGTAAPQFSQTTGDPELDALLGMFQQ